MQIEARSLSNDQTTSAELPLILLGQRPTAEAEPAVLLTVQADGVPQMRVGLSNLGDPLSGHQQAVTFGNVVFVGYGNEIYLVDTQTRSTHTYNLDEPFVAFHLEGDCLLVVTSRRLARLTPDAGVAWQTRQLADGDIVIQAIAAGRITGSGYWGSASGWRSFKIELTSGFACF